eukprot:jgi/Undpi1/10233/HiC_scaffold_28.g12686.m1
MAEGETGRARRTPADESPYSSAAFAAWEDALDKLKALDYEASFCKPNNLQPLSRMYFSVPGANASLQVDKYDDPNTAVNKLMLALTGMGFDLNFPANRLKQAYGEAVCSVLNFLTDKALVASGHVWRRPVYAAEDAAEEAEPVDDCDMADIVDEAEVEEEEEEEQDFAEINKAEEDEGNGISDSQAAMLEAKIDPVEWKRELERVGPRLKMAASTAAKEWRGHVEQTKKHEEAIQVALPVTTTQLALIGAEVTESVEKMRAKERFINSQHDGLREEYRQLHSELKAAEAKHETTSGSVGELTEALAALSDELQELKEKMDSKGDSMSEASPLVSIKQALQQIKAEIKTFDLRIGVVSHTLLSTKIRRGKNHASSPKDRRGNSGRGGPAGVDNEDFDMSDSGD